MGYEVEKLSIIRLVMMFILYVVVHAFIGMYQKKVDKKFEENPSLENGQIKKIFNFLFKWFPAIYVIFLLGIFYLG